MAQAQLSDILPKLHRHLMPTLLMMYVLAFLDRANVGFARAGLAADAGVGDAAFAFALPFSSSAMPCWKCPPT